MVDSCNLKCAACSHYSSLLGDKTYPSLEHIVTDLSFLKSKVGDNLHCLRMLGGEPLIHPQICDCLREIRCIFQKAELVLVTNGMLLSKMPDEFYKLCLDSNISVKITDYGIIDLKKVISELRERGISASYYKSSKQWHYQHIRTTEGEIDCLGKCIYKNICNNYRDGKIFLCPHIAYIDIFNEYFNKGIKLDDSDYIDLNEIGDFSELMERLVSSKPTFCRRYCNYYGNGHPKNGSWKKTEKKIEEFCLI